MFRRGLSSFRNLIAPEPQPLPPPGMYAFRREEGAEKARLHLRVEEDGSGVLLINASRILHLNPTAAAMAYLYLEERSEQEALQRLRRIYRAGSVRLKEDYLSFTRDLAEMIRPDGACPIHDLELEVTAPFSARPSAPYRMDLALTYRCNNACAHCYNPPARAGDELTTAEWKDVIDRLWALRIPHIIFTGGEPTLRPDLAELIAHAEQNGQICGLNTNGRRLSDAAYLESLIEAGLDHVQITLESHDESVHDGMVAAPGAWRQSVAGIRNALASRLYVMTNTTLLRSNAPSLSETLDFLAELGLRTVGLNALIYAGRGANVGSGLDESELPDLLALAREKTAAFDQRLIWYTPTEYCRFDPVLLELGVKGCTAALYNMCVEPDGGVLPCQSYYRPLGDIRRDPWEKIWNHELSVSLRERRYAPPKCAGCELLAECGGGCPLRTGVGI